QRLPHGFEVRTANFAELHLVTLVGTTTWTQHNECSLSEGRRGIRQLYDLGSCYPIAELVSFTVQPCRQSRQKPSPITGSSSLSAPVVWARSTKLTTTNCNESWR